MGNKKGGYSQSSPIRSDKISPSLIGREELEIKVEVQLVNGTVSYVRAPEEGRLEQVAASLASSAASGEAAASQGGASHAANGSSSRLQGESDGAQSDQKREFHNSYNFVPASTSTS